MRILILFIIASVIWPSIANATVIEFNVDGTVTTYEATDYLAASRHHILKPVVSFTTTTKGQEVLHFSKFDEFVRSASEKYDVSEKLIRAVIRTESANYADAVSPKGAQGLMQLMPATAKRLGVIDPFDPADNIEGGTKYLKLLLSRYNGDRRLALAAYNAGEGAVDKYNDVPPYPETMQYVEKIENMLTADQ